MSGELKLSKDYFGFKGLFKIGVDKYEFLYEDRLTDGIIDSEFKANKVIQIITKNKLANSKIKKCDNEAFLAGYIWGNDDKKNKFLVELKNSVIQRNFNFIRSVHGQFSGGLIRNNSIYMFRNILSQKNIFFRIKDNTLYFSTSFIDLIDNSIEFDEVALSSLCWGENVLPYRDIGILKEGQFLTYDSSGLKIETFDNICIDDRYTRSKFDSLVKEFKEIFSKSVVSKVNHYQSVGLMLSGGIDSGAILGALSYKKYDLGRLYTYTWGSKKYTSCNDFKYVNKIIQKYKINSTFVDVGDFNNIDMLNLGNELILPSNHCLYTWWMRAMILAKNNKNMCILSGHMADSLLDTNNLNYSTSGLNLRERFHLFFHGAGVPYYSYFRFKEKACISKTNFNGVDNRGIDIFTESSKENIKNFLSKPFNVFNLQYLTLDHTVFYENNLVHFSPYNDRDVQVFAHSLKDIYKRFPFQGKDISKPILRASFLNELPREVCSRVSKSNFEEVIFRYVYRNKRKILSIFKGSDLVQLGIVDFRNLEKVFNNRELLELNAGTILISGMVELWVNEIRKRRAWSYV